jgi:hypothetical protein
MGEEGRLRMNRIMILAASLALTALPGSSLLAETLSGTLYKAQACDCCEAHAEYLRRMVSTSNSKP